MQQEQQADTGHMDTAIRPMKIMEGGIGYRPDIDGLRALAVLAVVGFHYFPARVPGGFVGVDVFFVISGYLITGIIAREFEANRFSLWNFYQRRIRRIFPALALILAFCLIVGWCLLFSSEYAALGKSVAAGAGFVENFLLWQQAGYFDESAIRKPLLHLWSLAIEEQFYLLWPLTLWLAIRRRWPLLAAIAAIALLSFIVNVHGVMNNDADASFYSPAARAWELMVGAWLAVAHQRPPAWLARGRSAQAWLGLAAILVGIVVISKAGFPGFWALLPTLGTALMINAGAGALPNRTVLSWKPAVWVGLISYPLYLWHWVLLSMLVVVTDSVYVFTYPGSRWMRLGLIALSLLLSWGTYRFMEVPIRRMGKVRASLSLLAVVAALGLSGLAISLSDGLPNRVGAAFPVESEAYMATRATAPVIDDCVGRSKAYGWNCTLGQEDAPRWVLAYGDSHARALIPALDRYGHEAGIRIEFRGGDGCLVLLGLHDPEVGSKCRKVARDATDVAVTERPAGIVIVQRWTAYVGGLVQSTDVHSIHYIGDGPATKTAILGAEAMRLALDKTLLRYAGRHVPVLLLKDNPVQPTRAPDFAIRFARTRSGLAAAIDSINSSAVSRAMYGNDQAKANRVIDDVAAKYPFVSVLDVTPAMCGDRSCPFATREGFLYADDDHLSTLGAMRVYPLLADRLNRLLGTSAPVPPLRPLR